jgi:tetratricopeptide (TPR) repeat protein
MSTRPVIFISAVSRELRSARQLVANTLTFLGYEPEWQDVFGLEEGDLRAMLRRRIDASQGVVQLVGKGYGAEPPSIDEQFGRVSYTQFEALYAASKNKKVWYLFLDARFPIDPHEDEGDEKRKLQDGYRDRIKADAHLYHPLKNQEGLEAAVLRLRDDLTRLRRGVRRWATAVAGLLAVSVGLTVWVLQKQQHVGEQQEKTTQQVQALQEKIDKLEQGIASFTEIESKVRQEQPGQQPEAIEEQTYQQLAKQLGIDSKTLKEQLPRFAQELKKSPNATTYERANAAYVTKDYNEAERLAMIAADEAKGATPPKTAEAIKALELAAWAADNRVQYADALVHLRDAEKLTDRARDALEWARVQFVITYVLFDQGHYIQEEPILREALKEFERALGPEQPETLHARMDLANALRGQGKYSEAEAEDRAVLVIKQKVLGPEHPDTLRTRGNLAISLYDQGKYADAEAEDRAVLVLEEKVLGPEHPDTLRTRYNLALTLFAQDKYSEAEAEDRAVLILEEKVVGLEHPDALRLRNALAWALLNQGKYAEAEAEYRAVLLLQEKVLGPEQPETLGTRHDLALALLDQDKYSEAEAEDRAVLLLQEKVLGPEHPDTLKTRNSLALALVYQGKYAEAKALRGQAAQRK